MKNIKIGWIIPTIFTLSTINSLGNEMPSYIVDGGMIVDSIIIGFFYWLGGYIDGQNDA